MRSRILLSVVFGVLATCSPTKNGKSSQSLGYWKDSERLSPRQVELLTALQIETEGRNTNFSVELWDQGASPLDVRLNVEIDHPSSDPNVLVRAFLTQYNEIYHINREQLDSEFIIATASDYKDKPCTVVTVDQKLDGKRVYNARLAVQLEGKFIRSISGMFDPRPHSVVQPTAKMTRQQAVAKFASTNGWPEAALSELNSEPLDEVVYDPYYVLGGNHEPQPAFTFQQGVSPAIVLSAVDGATLVAAAGFEDKQVLGENACGALNSTTWQPAVVDNPITLTPTWLSFRHFGGARLGALTPEKAVRELLSSPVLQKMYGDAAPNEHLFVTNTASIGASTTVRAEQRVGGVRVLGSYLRATLSGAPGAYRVMEVFSRLPVFLPPTRMPNVTVETARPLASSAYEGWSCNQDADCLDSLERNVFREEEFIVPPHLDGLVALASAEYAVRFEFRGAIVWWSLSENKLLAVESRLRSSIEPKNRIWQPLLPTEEGYRDTNELIDTRTHRVAIEQDGTERPPLHSEAFAVRAMVSDSAAAMHSTFQWDNLWGDGTEFPYPAALDVSIQPETMIPDKDGNASAGLIQFINQERHEVQQYAIFLGAHAIVRDVFAHEYTHLTLAQLGLASLGEPRTVEEHLADVMSLGMFPDPSFQMGEGMTSFFSDPGGPKYIRNVLNPNDPLARGNDAIVHMDRRGDCAPEDAIFCYYRWIGIPNRVFGLTSVGSPTWPGLGQQRAAKLWFELARDSAATWQLESYDNLTPFGVKLRAVCRAVKDGLSEAQGAKQRVGPLTDIDCNELDSALDSVGLLGRITGAYARYTHAASTDQVFTLNAGKRLQNGCRIRSHTLKVKISDGLAVKSYFTDINDTPPFTIDISDKEIHAEVLERCGGAPTNCSDDTNLEMRIRVRTKYAFGVNVDPEVVLETNGLPESACFHQDPNAKSVYYWSTPISHLRSFAFFGEKKDFVVRPNLVNGAHQNGPCRIIGLAAIDEHEVPFPHVDMMQFEYSHGAHGYRATRLSPQNQFDYGAELHLWVDGFQFMFSRVVYELEESPNQVCDFPGLARVPLRFLE